MSKKTIQVKVTTLYSVTADEDAIMFTEEEGRTNMLSNFAEAQQKSAAEYCQRLNVPLAILAPGTYSKPLTSKAEVVAE